MLCQRLPGELSEGRLIVKRKTLAFIDVPPFASLHDRALPDKIDGDNFTL
jgi:hypothetical protein